MAETTTINKLEHVCKGSRSKSKPAIFMYMRPTVKALTTAK